VNQVIDWNGNNYALQNWSDQYVFNPAGLMTDMTAPATRMQLFYNNNLLSGILIDGKHHCAISTDSSGKITRLFYKDSTGNKEASFKYDSTITLCIQKMQATMRTGSATISAQHGTDWLCGYHLHGNQLWPGDKQGHPGKK